MRDEDPNTFTLYSGWYGMSGSMVWEWYEWDGTHLPVGWVVLGWMVAGWMTPMDGTRMDDTNGWYPPTIQRMDG
jgi:hypothetical protein